MVVLYAISIASLFALLWAVFAVTRHIRSTHSTEEQILPTPPKPGMGERPFIEPERAFLKANAAASRTNEPLTQDLPIHGVRRQPRPVPARRPASAPRTSDRSDWAYYNKDLGDLKDPAPPVRPRTKQA